MFVYQKLYRDSMALTKMAKQHLFIFDMRLFQNTTVAAGTNKQANKLPQTPSISITALPRQTNNVNNTMIPNNSRMPYGAASTSSPTFAGIKPGQIAPCTIECEICDAHIKDLESLRNHMHSEHRVKVCIDQWPLQCVHPTFSDDNLLINPHCSVNRFTRK